MSNTLIRQLFEIDNCDLVATSDRREDEKKIKELSLKYDGQIPDCCPVCGQKMHKHGDRKFSVLDTPLGGACVILNFTVPRYRCQNPECKHIWQPQINGIDPKRSVTKRAFVDVTQRSLRMPFEHVCNDYAFTLNTAKNIFVDYIREMEKHVHFITPSFLGLDEIKFKKHGEVTVVTDLEHHTMFDMFEGRNKKRLVQYFSALHDAGKIEWVCSDMYRPFEDTLKATMPNARWVVDHFHVVSKANEALDFLRRSLQGFMSPRDRVKTKKGLGWTLKVRYRDLSTEEAEKIRLLRRNPNLAILADAYDLKERFFNIYDENPTSVDNAKAAFAEWEASIPKSPLFDKFRDVAEMVHNHYDAVFNWWVCPASISNGFTECSNRLLRENNLRGRGYSFEILRARTLYRNSNLRNIELIGQDIGPEILEFEPNFLYEGQPEEEEIDYATEEDDTIIDGVNIATGEIAGEPLDDAASESD